MKFLSKFYIGLIFLILYAPILVVILFSFNGSGSLSSFSGFSLYWYRELFRDGEALTALKNSLLLAVLSSLLATLIGTLAAFSISRAKSKRYQRIAEGVSNIPMMNPDIVTGVSTRRQSATVSKPVRHPGPKGRMGTPRSLACWA